MNILILISLLIIGFLLGKFRREISYYIELIYVIVGIFFIRLIYRIRTGKSLRKENRRRELESYFPNGPLPVEYFREKGYPEDWIEDYIKTYK